ncbi:hypothetical protein ABC304_03040 [Microbacterium sp. 1P10UB]|uniref:hypothetical protein n=1 Tax=unclassified Microbacterium TaxID=2609290 RepID=UPI0039A02867
MAFAVALSVFYCSVLQSGDPAEARWDVATKGASGSWNRVVAAATVSSGTYEESSSAIAKVGDWVTAKHSSDSAGASANAKARGNYAELSFSGDSVEWIGRSGPSLGIAEVFVDGVMMKQVDLYSSQQTFQTVLFRAGGLGAGAHVIRIVRTGTHSAGSTGNDISLDAFRVVDNAAPAAPRNVSVTPARDSLLVKWDSSSEPDVVGYRLYRALEDGPFSLVSGTDSLVATSFLDIGLTYGARYRYAVTAIDSSGNQSSRGKLPSAVQPPPVTPPFRASSCPTTGTKVSTLEQLRTAVAGARPGTVILLAPGTYRGGITVTSSGTTDNPIWICGPRTAVLDNQNVQSKNGVHLDGADNVHIAGISIQNFRKGVVISGSNGSSVADVSIASIGEEAIKIRYSSTDTAVLYNVIRQTGLAIPMYGEGIYLGTSPKDWCAVNNCEPDRSDRAIVVGNDIARTTADPIEAKPGTSGGVIRGNTIDADGVSEVTTIIAVKGNDYIVVDNVARNGVGPSGFYASETEVAGWGQNNIFARNTVALRSAGVAIYVKTGANNVVDCSNTPAGQGVERSNVVCQK